MSPRCVRVPPKMEVPFEEAEHYVGKYFESFRQDPTHGTIEIGGERYVLLRSASLSCNFHEFITRSYPSIHGDEADEAAAKVLYDMAHSFGSNDAKVFHKKAGLTTPISKLSTGPVHFAYSGWAFVAIDATSTPTADENYYLLFDHPQSFEADAWIAEKRATATCVCHMNAGYATGWCEESFSISLHCREILCRAKGDPYCRFIMSQPHRIEEFIKRYQDTHTMLFGG